LELVKEAWIFNIVVVKQTLTTVISLVNLTRLNQEPMYVIRFLPMIFEDWFTILIACVMSYSIVVLANVLKVALHSTYLADYFQSPFLYLKEPLGSMHACYLYLAPRVYTFLLHQLHHLHHSDIANTG